MCSWTRARCKASKTPAIYLNKVQTLALWKHESVFVRRFSFPLSHSEQEKKMQTKQILTSIQQPNNSHIVRIQFFFCSQHEGWTWEENEKKNHSIEKQYAMHNEWHRSSRSGELYWNIIIRIMYLWHHFLIYMKRLSFVIRSFHVIFCSFDFWIFVLTSSIKCVQHKRGLMC